jgi:hypothetical protein
VIVHLRILLERLAKLLDSSLDLTQHSMALSCRCTTSQACTMAHMLHHYHAFEAHTHMDRTS